MGLSTYKERQAVPGGFKHHPCGVIVSIMFLSLYNMLIYIYIYIYMYVCMYIYIYISTSSHPLTSSISPIIHPFIFSSTGLSVLIPLAA